MSTHHKDADFPLTKLVEFLKQQDLAGKIEISFSVRDLGLQALRHVQPAIWALRALASLRILRVRNADDKTPKTLIFVISKIQAQRFIDFMDKRGDPETDPLSWDI